MSAVPEEQPPQATPPATPRPEADSGRFGLSDGARVTGANVKVAFTPGPGGESYEVALV